MGNRVDDLHHVGMLEPAHERRLGGKEAGAETPTRTALVEPAVRSRLTATSRWLNASWQRKTSLVAPSPSRRSTRYLPICAGTSATAASASADGTGEDSDLIGGRRLWRILAPPMRAAGAMDVALRCCAAAEKSPRRCRNVESPHDRSQTVAARGPRCGDPHDQPRDAAAADFRDAAPGFAWRSGGHCCDDAGQAAQAQPARGGAGTRRGAAWPAGGRRLGIVARDRRPRLHQPAPQARCQAGRDQRSAARRRALRPANRASTSRCSWNSYRPTPPGRCTWATGARRRSATPLCKLFETQGRSVTREFYYNDAGVQIATLAASVQARIARPPAGRRAMARSRLQRRVHRRYRRRLQGRQDGARRRPQLHGFRRRRRHRMRSASSRWPICAMSRTWTCRRSACASTTTSSSRACTAAGASNAR